MNTPIKLKDIITVSSHFNRSVNIALDQDNKALINNYICPHSSATVLYSMVQQIQQGQCAFTWTGPYGSGKSSLALFLSIIANESTPLYKHSIDKIPIYKDEIQSFLKKSNYTIHTIVGALEDPIVTIAKALNTEPTADAILDTLSKIASGSQRHLIIIDEMGKFLEFSARNPSSDSDVYLYQQIAEIANRSNGKLVFLGILHQSIIEYTRELTQSLRDEWLKVQGRFVDLAVNAAGEEQLELIGNAIESAYTPTIPSKIINTTVSTIARNRPIKPDIFISLLINTWPLHPVVATLLIPVSQKRFSQNHRSIFSFLNSAEPYGFQNFLEQDIPELSKEKLKNHTYSPDHYWLYLTANLENAILSSDEASQWILAREALNRAEAQDLSALAISLLKWIILIDLFRGNSGLEATIELFHAEFQDKQSVMQALEDLLSLNLIRKANRKGSYALFNGSDFDLSTAKELAKKEVLEIDYKRLNQIAAFNPIIAKRNYHKTGAMRFMDISIIPSTALKKLNHNRFNESLFGALYIVIPKDLNNIDEVNTALLTYRSNSHPILLGIPHNISEIIDISYELQLVDWIATHHPELAGDRIARSEVENEQTRLVSQLHQALLSAMSSLKIYYNQELLGVLSPQSLSQLCSDLADELYSQTPILHTELLNNDKPSGSANGGLNALLKRMVTHAGKERLGIEGFPTEGGLFKILLEDTHLYHQSEQGRWEYHSPEPNNAQNLHALWAATNQFLSERSEEITLDELYEFWQSPPFGIKHGLLSFLALSYLLTQEGFVATYINETYITNIDDLFVDYLVKSAKGISFRFVPQNRTATNIISGIINAMNVVSIPGNYNLRQTPLEISKSLVQMVYNLNEWVLRTRSLDKKTLLFREILKRARDPYKLIFDEIVPLFTTDDRKTKKDQVMDFNAFEAALKELLNAYPKLLDRFKQTLLNELQIKKLDLTTISTLQERAESVYQASGDFRIDALASRLTKYEGTDDQIAGILGLAANKPTQDWIDLDVERATIELATLCQGFKRAELFTHIKGKQAHRHSVAIISSFAGEDTIQEISFEYLESDKEDIKALKEKIKGEINKNHTPEQILTALSELSAYYMKALNKKRGDS